MLTLRFFQLILDPDGGCEHHLACRDQIIRHLFDGTGRRGFYAKPHRTQAWDSHRVTFRRPRLNDIANGLPRRVDVALGDSRTDSCLLNHLRLRQPVVEHRTQNVAIRTRILTDLDQCLFGLQIDRHNVGTLDSLRTTGAVGDGYPVVCDTSK